MALSVLARCPVCRREHQYTPPTYPCGCGAPVSLPLVKGGVPVRIEKRTWAGSWVKVRCGSCQRVDEWPQPEFGCPCGATLRLPVDRSRMEAEEPPTSSAPQTPRTPLEERSQRPSFEPLTIRTAQDARAAAARYLRWMGFEDVTAAENRPASGVDLRGRGVIAHVDPTTSPVSARAVETLWLNGLNESATAVCFGLAGYVPPARTRADELGLPLFVIDLTGTPQPVNDAASELLDKR